MVGVDDIVITGLGSICPLGIGRESLASALSEGRSAVHLATTLEDTRQTSFYAAKVDDFDGKQYVKPRKALKVMSREVQMAYSAAQLAWQDAGLEGAELESDRLGVVYGSELMTGDPGEIESAVNACSTEGKMDFSAWGREFSKEIFPLWMLRNLPNMPACHVGIAIDARGPNNTIAQDEISSLLSLIEAAGIIERDQADLMVVGGIGNRSKPDRMVFAWQALCDNHPHASTVHDSPRCNPFSERTFGIVPQEGAGAVILERRSHAVKRGANILAEFLAGTSRCAEPPVRNGGSRVSIASALQGALSQAQIEPNQLDHLNAQGFGHHQLDLEESHGIQQALGNVPVTAFSPRMGTGGSGCGIIELVASLVGMQAKRRFGMHGHPGASSDCPVNLCVEDCDVQEPIFMKSNFTCFGQAVAVVLKMEG